MIRERLREVAGFMVDDAHIVESGKGQDRLANLLRNRLCRPGSGHGFNVMAKSRKLSCRLAIHRRSPPGVP